MYRWCGRERSGTVGETPPKKKQVEKLLLLHSSRFGNYRFREVSLSNPGSIFTITPHPLRRSPAVGRRAIGIQEADQDLHNLSDKGGGLPGSVPMAGAAVVGPMPPGRLLPFPRRLERG